MIAGADLGAEVDLGAGANPSSRPEKPSLRELDLKEPEVAEPNALADLLPFTMILLLCATASLRVESSSDLLGAAELCKRFL